MDDSGILKMGERAMLSVAAGRGVETPELHALISGTCSTRCNADGGRRLAAPQIASTCN